MVKLETLVFLLNLILKLAKAEKKSQYNIFKTVMSHKRADIIPGMYLLQIHSFTETVKEPNSTPSQFPSTCPPVPVS